MILKKIKAGALQFTMFVVVVVALMLAAFIILIHTQKQFKIKTALVKETLHSADLGIHYALHNPIVLNDTLAIKLENDEFKDLKVHRDYWGVFEKVVSVSTAKNNRFTKVALVGASQPNTNRTALYVQDNNRPLVLVGNTKIQGVAYLPKQGVRTGNISGHSYYGNQLVYGKSKTSSKLPKISKDLHKQLKTITNSTQFIEEHQFINIEHGKTYKNSFLKPLQLIYNQNTIALSQVKLVGHIIVQSKTKIIVDASAGLSDVILIAPKIEIQNHVKGTFQAIATKEISIGKNCLFNYPSSLILNDPKTYKTMSNTAKNTSFIKVNKGTTVKGIVAYMSGTKNYKSQLFIDENATIVGEVYCNKNLELLGSVNGTIYTASFVANQSGSVYQNHIYNGTVEVNKLPEEYSGLILEGTNKSVSKWLY